RPGESLAFLQHAHDRASAAPQGVLVDDVGAEAVDGPDARLVDFVRVRPAPGRAQRLPQVALQVRRRLAGEGDRDDVGQRDRLLPPLAADFDPEQVQDPRDDGRCLPRSGAGLDQYVLLARPDGLPLRVGRWDHHESPRGPPGMRQMSRPWQNGGQLHDAGGSGGKIPSRMLPTCRATSASALPYFPTAVSSATSWFPLNWYNASAW